MPADSKAAADQEQRRRALDPSTSFIVQAPAGAGKTELLIQRYLVLLARVEEPESIVAITFTKKAAGEMRNRVVEALQKAANGARPVKAHEAQTWDLASDALANDRSRGWNLCENPARMRIRTIDSLCAGLSRQMPWLSRLGAPPEIVEDAREMYREAARNTLRLLEGGGAFSGAVERLLVHLDNDLSKIEELLAGMLGRRDQWLRHVRGRSGPEARAALEEALQNVVSEGLTRALACLRPGLTFEIASLARFAAANVDEYHPLAACRDLVAFPDADPEELPVWRGIAALLLTDSGEIRRRLTCNNGFPPAAKIEKQRFDDVAAALRGTQFPAALCEVTELPPPCYSDPQWEVVEALLELLPVAAAQLWTAFAAAGAIDFVQIGQAALDALGEPDNPTDLAFAMDFRVQHLLVDEFQDTSYTQFELLERLTAGWEPGDGRTLFVVGDPMQSIYRFREAEVGLFLRASRSGLGHIPLEPLRLTVNFRSEKGIVDWVNSAFKQVMPGQDDIASGAVRYSDSEAHNGPGPGQAVSVHPFFKDDPEAEAQLAVELAREARKANPQGTTAVLVRARSHLPAILKAFREADLRYRAIEIDALSDRWVVQDLLALTRALLHAADRVSWLAVLRAPWCGLTLADLELLTRGDVVSAVWDLMRTRAGVLSEDGRKRLARVSPVLERSLAQRRRMPLRVWVEQAWIELGGPACLAAGADLEDARAFLDLLEERETGGDLLDFEGLGEQVNKLFAQPDLEAGDGLQVMSIHKAKGLQFDTVIVPGLGHGTPREEERLLRWLVRPTSRAEAELLLAPVKVAGSEGDPIYQYLTRIESQKADYEAGRLLYVAATRAKKKLHLIGHVNLKKDGGIATPRGETLLRRLWPVVEADFVHALPDSDECASAQGTLQLVPPGPVLHRLRTDWVLPAPPPEVRRIHGPEVETEDEEVGGVSFHWASDTARHIGTVVHGALERIARDGLDQWPADRVRAEQSRFRTALRGLGVPADELPDAVERVEAALLYSVTDPRGRWILGAHPEARTEYALTGVARGKVWRTIIDRTFVDADGVRWIVDYKTGSHEGGDIETFLLRERERYQEKLELYGGLMCRLDGRPVRLGLYFPLAKGWHEWSPAAVAE